MDEEQIEYSWREDKAVRNLQKHKISFEEATTAFSDPQGIEFFDDEHSCLSEERWNFIGRTFKDKLLFIVFTEDEEEDGVVLRWLISARLAESSEKRSYESE